MSYPDASAVAAIDRATTARVGPATTSAVRTSGATSWRACSPGPVELHKASGLDRELYALARCIASEAPPQGAAALAIGECLRWEARRQGCDVYQLVAMRSSAAYAWTRGNYGEQRGRFASTSRDPTERSLTAARASATSSITGGAGRWFAPRVQDGGRQGTGTLTKDAIQLAQSWGTQGWGWIGPLPGVDSYVTSFLRSGPPTDNRELVEVIKLGRLGKATVGLLSPDLHTAAVAAHGVPWWILAGGVAVAVLSQA